MQARKAKRKARKAERKYDESMAYNKNLSPEARLHYLENERADKDGTSMYGKGPNAFGVAEAIGIASLAEPYVKPVLSGIESLGAGERFSEGFSMKKKKSLKKDITEFGKTEFGKELKGKGIKKLDKLIKETGKTLKGAKMTGKEKGPDLLGMGKKETKGAIGGALAGGLMYGPLGALAGGLAGKAFGKGRDRKEAEKGTGANMMGNSISKHMGGRGCNMYGDGPDMLLGRKGRKEARENIKDVILAPTRLASNIATKIAGEGPKTRKEARQEIREARQERRLNKIEGASMYGDPPKTWERAINSIRSTPIGEKDKDGNFVDPAIRSKNNNTLQGFVDFATDPITLKRASIPFRDYGRFITGQDEVDEYVDLKTGNLTSDAKSGGKKQYNKYGK